MRYRVVFVDDIGLCPQMITADNPDDACGLGTDRICYTQNLTLDEFNDTFQLAIIEPVKNRRGGDGLAVASV